MKMVSASPLHVQEHKKRARVLGAVLDQQNEKHKANVPQYSNSLLLLNYRAIIFAQMVMPMKFNLNKIKMTT